MERNHCPTSPSGESGSGFFSLPGSSPDVDSSSAPSVSNSEVDCGPLNWESDWIDIGGEG